MGDYITLAVLLSLYQWPGKQDRYHTIYRQTLLTFKQILYLFMLYFLSTASIISLYIILKQTRFTQKAECKQCSGCRALNEIVVVLLSVLEFDFGEGYMLI